MKVLILHPQLWLYGGAERVIVELCNYLTDNFIESTILTTGIIPEIKKDLKETRIIECANYEEMIYSLHDIYEDFDIINVHNDPTQLFIYPKQANVVWLCNEPSTEYFATGDIDHRRKDIVKRFVKKIIVADEANKERIKKIYGLDSEIIPYGVDYEFFNKKVTEEEISECKKEYSLEDSFVITQVGFIAHTKNQLKTIEIFENVKKTIPNAKLVLAGPATPDGEYLKLVKDEIVKRNLYGQVEITGKLTREELRVLYNCTDVALLPVQAQGSWLSAFEAMSAFVPVVVSKEFTASNLIEKMGLGYVCSSTEEYVNAIIEATGKDKSTVHSNQFVKENLTWDNFCKNMVEVFKDSNK
jgi:glycosyltransferase involved in cell wall biosynthesis